MELLAILERIPAIIWSALLASALTLTGVMISNRSNTMRLLTQLEHDASQKAKDRMATLHREVYLKLAEEMARATAFSENYRSLTLLKKTSQMAWLSSSL